MPKTLIKNAIVYNGLNEVPKEMQVCIEGDKIITVQKNIPEHDKKVIDAQGLCLAPGFIDTHASTGFGYFFENYAEHKLLQGITTEIIGNCGTSPAPIGNHLQETMEGLSEEIGFPYEWDTLANYFEKIKDNLQFNIATLIGHSTVRAGYVKDWQNPTTEEQVAMEKALETAIKDGALGLSTGLIYSPGCFATTKEIVALAKVVKRMGGVYASHIRDERNKLLEAIEEALLIGEKAEIPVLISHLKAAEKQNWGKIAEVIKILEEYNKNHTFKAMVDVYPYTAVSTKLNAFVPKYLLEDGISAIPEKINTPKAKEDITAWVKERNYDLDNMIIISAENEAYAGKSVQQIADEQQLTVTEIIVQVLTENPQTWIVYHCISELDMDYAITWENAMICTDSWSYPVNAPKAIGKPHPRSYGAFTTFLEKYVMEKSLLSWQEAIHKITDMPAQFFKLKNRGRIEEGYFADMVLFDKDKIKANATYLNPRQLSEGMDTVWVNGVPMIKEGKLQGNKSGKILTL